MFEVAGVDDHVLGGCAIVGSDIVFHLSHLVYVSGTLGGQRQQVLIGSDVDMNIRLAWRLEFLRSVTVFWFWWSEVPML